MKREPIESKKMIDEYGNCKFYSALTTESHEERIKEAFEKYKSNPMVQDADYSTFKSGYQSRDAEVKAIKKLNDQYIDSLDECGAEITALKQQIEDMMEDFEEIEDNLYQDCCGGSDHDPIQAIIDKWTKRGEK